jgi:ribosomal protein S12 methylthiotransferase accessory factor
MRRAVDPVTGLVSGMLVRKDDQPGATTSAYTTGMPTTWFSPVKAQPEGGVRATLAALGEAAIDPRTLPLGSDSEYARLTRYGPFDPDTQIDWVRGVSLTTGRVRYVPACAVYLPYRFPRGHKPWYDTISNGLAAGRDAAHAALGGLLELVERDAAVIFWSNRLTLPTLDLSLLADGPAREMATRLRAGGARLPCKDLTTDLGVPVAGVQVLAGTSVRPVVTHAARAALDMRDAIQGALEEACLCLASTETVLDRDGVPEPLKVLRGRPLATAAAPAHRPGHAPGRTDRSGRPAGHRRVRDHHGRHHPHRRPRMRRLGRTHHRPGPAPHHPARRLPPARRPPRLPGTPLAMGARTTPLAEDELNSMPHPFL